MNCIDALDAISRKLAISETGVNRESTNRINRRTNAGRAPTVASPYHEGVLEISLLEQ